jgi:hypothetical protein
MFHSLRIGVKKFHEMVKKQGLLRKSITIMTKRMLILLIVVFTSLMFLTIGLFAAEEIDEENEEVGIFNEGYKRKLKNGENIWEEGDSVQNCIACHSPIKKQQENVHRLVFAYHFNCKKCHIENEAGPVECKECHTKK